MLTDFKPIIFNTPHCLNGIELYFAHDIHKGSELHDEQKWKAFKNELLSADNRFVVFVGDCFENAIVGSKSDVYTQKFNPYEQKEWFTAELKELADKTIAVVSGNHCARTTKTVGLYPLYDCCVAAGIAERYRQHFAFVDIGVGVSTHGKDKQFRYVGYLTHKLKDIKSCNGADFVDGIDFAAYGHDHTPKDQPRAKLVYDNKNKTVALKDIEIVDSGSFLTYGGYAADSGYRPSSSKCYKLILDGKTKEITSVGFHV